MRENKKSSPKRSEDQTYGYTAGMGLLTAAQHSSHLAAQYNDIWRIMDSKRNDEDSPASHPDMPGSNTGVIVDSTPLVIPKIAWDGLANPTVNWLDVFSEGQHDFSDLDHLGTWTHGW